LCAILRSLLASKSCSSMASSIFSPWNLAISASAQFLAVCRSVKTSKTCENLLFVTKPVSRHQEMLSHAGALVCPPAL
jgi:hypothetical protein